MKPAFLISFVYCVRLHSAIIGVIDGGSGTLESSRYPFLLQVTQEFHCHLHGLASFKDIVKFNAMSTSQAYLGPRYSLDPCGEALCWWYRLDSFSNAVSSTHTFATKEYSPLTTPSVDGTSDYLSVLD